MGWDCVHKEKGLEGKSREVSLGGSLRVGLGH